jgi:hypothetical protein
VAVDPNTPLTRRQSWIERLLPEVEALRHDAEALSANPLAREILSDRRWPFLRFLQQRVWQIDEILSWFPPAGEGPSAPTEGRDA